MVESVHTRYGTEYRHSKAPDVEPQHVNLGLEIVMKP